RIMRLSFLKQLKIIFLGLGILLIAGAGRCFAQDISVSAEVSSRQIVLGDSAQLSITVSGSQDVEPVQLPPIDGFEASFLGPSTRVSIVNGQYSSSKTFTYSLFALKEGTFEIPALNVIVSGQTYTTEPFSVAIVGLADRSAAPLPGQSTSLKDKIFLVLEVPKREIYLNERFNVKISLFVSGLSVQDVQYPQFDGVGFSDGEYGQPRQYQQIVNGISYQVVEFMTDIYPTRTGALQLGPVKTTCNILVGRANRAMPFGSRGSIFDDDFFNSFFDRQEKQPITLESEAVAINVLDFPKEGKPENFSGAVGKFDFNVSVGPQEVKEGDPITLRMTVIGEKKQNLTAVQMPSLAPGTGFKVYDPQILEKDNIKKTEQVIIPQSDTVKEVPAITFSYFDPQLKKYQTITQGPFPIKVAKPEKSDEFKVIGLEGAVRPPEPETLGQDIIFIKRAPGRLKPLGQALTKSFVFFCIIFLAAVLWVAAFIHYKRTARIRTDSVYARRLQAPRQARQGLALAQKLMASGKKEMFYDVVFKTIQQYLGNKFHLPSGAVTFEAVRGHLQKNNIEQRIVDDIALTYSECDMIRYASADISPENMDVTYQRLAHVIDHLERFVK
ncbi:MAG TPA: BatD family protein, partial [Candidatus Omnitrophota bacterium]|nr:BatD family protein [Candidatus Omnitrophota bacterium]